MKDLTSLPANLPVPNDDGACSHLKGVKIHGIELLSTNDRKVTLCSDPGITVLYFYPMIGNPNAPPLPGWNEIAGARGCTPQSCAYRDHFAELKQLGVTNLFGVSAQPVEEQKAAVKRLHLPFELLNDSLFELTDKLKLPTFEYENLRLIKRLTLIIENGIIIKVFYPVFPPNENANDVITWLQANKT
jgi:peroxiredoxin